MPQCATTQIWIRWILYWQKKGAFPVARMSLISSFFRKKCMYWRNSVTLKSSYILCTQGQNLFLETHSFSFIRIWFYDLLFQANMPLVFNPEKIQPHRGLLFSHSNMSRKHFDCYKMMPQNVNWYSQCKFVEFQIWMFEIHEKDTSKIFYGKNWITYLIFFSARK